MSQAIARSTALTSAANAPLLFPILSAAQIARIGSHGLVRPITRGEVLIERGQTDVPFFVVKAGEIEIFRINELELVAQIFTSWNPMTSWMRQIERFLKAA